MKACTMLLCCLLCAACSTRPLTPPVEKPQGLIRFSAWYAANGVEVPLQGVVRLQRDLQATKRVDRLERLGLVMSHGATVGVTVWDAEGNVQRKPGDFPGTYGLLITTEQCAVALLRLRGIAAPDKAFAAHSERESEVRMVPQGAQDAIGPLEMLCKRDGSQVTVHITEELR